eukprot:TRINITY_DN1833_c0_g1_i1.p1 TRINITY_DN1833_c0_g1~~TRINITY_DN1833_c0_g1_i1.p1  ORF type:complete len:237 (-),score=15.62 TRINITY_DN1833_c0_g1_i1:63-677(-)
MEEDMIPKSSTGYPAKTSWPPVQKVLFFSICFVTFTIWFAITTLQQRIQAIFIGTMFAVIEIVWRGTKKTRQLKEPITIKNTLKNGHTTWEQWFMMIVHAPFGTDLYFSVLSHPLLRLILFPLNVWIAELVWGAVFAYCWIRRPWYYTSPYARFDGLIRIDYWWVWLLLGLTHEFLFHSFFGPVSHLVSDLTYDAYTAYSFELY